MVQGWFRTGRRFLERQENIGSDEKEDEGEKSG